MADNEWSNELRIGQTQPLTGLKREESFLKKIAPAFTILSAVIAVTALLLNISFRKKSFTCTYLGSESLVQINKGALNGPLAMRYQDRPIDSLYKLRFTIKNTGSVAIKSADVVEPLQLLFPSGYSLIDSPIIEQRKPDFSLSIVRDTTDTHKLLISFPLMNGNDEATFSIFALSLGSASPRLNGRIVDVAQVANVDLGRGKARPRSSPALGGPFLWTLTVVNGLICLACVAFLVGCTVSYVRRSRWEKKWKQPAEEAVAKARSLRDADPSAKLQGYSEQIEWRKQVLATAGVPQRPDSIFTSGKDYLQLASVLVLYGIVTGLTTYVVCVSSLQ